MPDQVTTQTQQSASVPTQTMPEPIVPKTREDIGKMTTEQLEKFVEMPKEDDAGGQKAAPQAITTQTTQTQAGAEGTPPWMEIEIDGPTPTAKQKLKFKSEEEFRKSFANTHKVLRNQKQIIDKFNAERGQLGKVAQDYEASKARVQELTNYIQQLQAGAGQAATGQHPNAAFQQALSNLQSQNPTQDPYSLMVGEITALKNELNQVKQGFTQKEADLQVQTGVKSMFDEINDFTKKHAEYATSVPFAELDDLVCQNGLELAQTMMTPDDFAKYQVVEKLMWLYRGTGDPETDPEAVLDVDDDGKNYNDLEEAFLIHQHRNGSNAEAIANARQSGVQSTLRVLERASNAAVTIPNTLSGAQKQPMGPAEIAKILESSKAQRRKDPALQQKWLEAMQQMNIDTTEEV